MPGPAASTASPSGPSKRCSTCWPTCWSPRRGRAASRSHAAWAVDALPATDALAAASAAKAYCARAARAVVRDGHSGARGHRQHLGLPGPCVPAPGAPLRRSLRWRRRPAWSGSSRPAGLGGRRWTSLTRPRSATSACACARGWAHTIPASRRRRRPTSTGRARRRGTRRSTTPASSACRGRRRLAATGCPASTT